MRRKTIAQLVDVDAANMLCPLSVFLKKKNIVYCKQYDIRTFVDHTYTMLVSLVSISISVCYLVPIFFNKALINTIAFSYHIHPSE